VDHLPLLLLLRRLSNIPEYARPYVETMLGATQQQIFNTEQVPSGYDENGNVTGYSTNITGIKPYVPYSQNPQDYVAPFSPLQQQAMQGAANLQTPSQYGAATQMAGIGGLGTMGTAGQEAQAGAQDQRAAYRHVWSRRYWRLYRTLILLNL